MMNHGGDNILILDNEVHDCDFAYAITYPTNTCVPSTRTWIVNNSSTNSPKNCQWIAGPEDALCPISRDHAVIGNRYDGSTGPVLVYRVDGLVLTHNTMTGLSDSQGRAVRWGAAGCSQPIANVWRIGNDWGGGLEVEGNPPFCQLVVEDAPPAAVPAMPQDLQARQFSHGVMLTWKYSFDESHDSFQVDRSADGISGWETVAFRPPNDGHWGFGSSNPYWVTFNPLAYMDRGGTGGFYRMRALNGVTASPWTSAAHVSQ